MPGSEMYMKPLILACLLASVLSGTVVASDEARSQTRSGIGLALGSGGAGGLAHIAVLQVFDDLDIQPDHISGTSIGAIIGGLYAAGLDAAEILDLFDDFGGSELDALTRMAKSDLDLRDLLKLDLAHAGLFDAEAFLRFLGEHTDARDFSDLRIPLSVVATDYWSGDPVAIREGELLPAIKASMAVPGLFSPVARGDQLLIDGGTSNPLPWDLLREDHDIVIAVDVSGTRERIDSEKPGVTDILFHTFEIMQQSLIRQQMRIQQPDIYLKPDTSGIRLLHFNRIDTILKQAEPAAEELRRLLEQY